MWRTNNVSRGEYPHPLLVSHISCQLFSLASSVSDSFFLLLTSAFNHSHKLPVFTSRQHFTLACTMFLCSSIRLQENLQGPIRRPDLAHVTENWWTWKFALISFFWKSPDQNVEPMRRSDFSQWPYNHASIGNEFKKLFCIYLIFYKRDICHSLLEDTPTFQNQQIYKFLVSPPYWPCPTRRWSVLRYDSQQGKWTIYKCSPCLRRPNGLGCSCMGRTGITREP